MVWQRIGTRRLPWHRHPLAVGSGGRFGPSGRRNRLAQPSLNRRTAGPWRASIRPRRPCGGDGSGRGRRADAARHPRYSQGRRYAWQSASGEETRMARTSGRLYAFLSTPAASFAGPARHTGSLGTVRAASLATCTLMLSGKATPFFAAVSSARMEIAISAGVLLPM